MHIQDPAEKAWIQEKFEKAAEPAAPVGREQEEKFCAS